MEQTLRALPKPVLCGNVGPSLPILSQDMMPGDCSAGNRKCFVAHEIPFVHHSRALVTVLGSSQTMQ
eukprot:1415920-Amphidinium_carterae.1